MSSAHLHSQVYTLDWWDCMPLNLNATTLFGNAHCSPSELSIQVIWPSRSLVAPTTHPAQLMNSSTLTNTSHTWHPCLHLYLQFHTCSACFYLMRRSARHQCKTNHPVCRFVSSIRSSCLGHCYGLFMDESSLCSLGTVVDCLGNCLHSWRFGSIEPECYRFLCSLILDPLPTE